MGSPSVGSFEFVLSGVNALGDKLVAGLSILTQEWVQDDVEYVYHTNW